MFNKYINLYSNSNVKYKLLGAMIIIPVLFLILLIIVSVILLICFILLLFVFIINLLTPIFNYIELFFYKRLADLNGGIYYQ